MKTYFGAGGDDGLLSDGQSRFGRKLVFHYGALLVAAIAVPVNESAPMPATLADAHERHAIAMSKTLPTAGCPWMPESPIYDNSTEMAEAWTRHETEGWTVA